MRTLSTIGYEGKTLDEFIGELKQAVVAKPLEHPVYMHRGEAGRVGQVGLGERQFVAVAVGEADDLEPDEKLAKQVGYAGGRASPSDRQDLLAVNGRVEKS